MAASKPSEGAGPVWQSLTDYASRVANSSAHSDEMLGPDGGVRPDWAALYDHLSTFTPEQLQSRFARGDQYLRDAGVLFRQYDESVSSEREWPLSHIPVILGQDEWQEISAGLIERADLLEFILRDFYGANTLVTSGQLPATLLSQNAAWLRPMVGVPRDDRAVLNSISFEIARGPDGRWWVISDLVEAPSTVGFTIENRIAMRRVFPNFFAESNILRLAGHFRDFQQNLLALKGQTEGEIAILTPGPMNQNYPEHAYLARYLGLALLEGEDMVVKDRQAMVRTVAGTQPISLVWSRLPSRMIDPLELSPHSMLGTPGVLQAIRDGVLHTVNMVGAGVLETRALMAFMPSIARQRLGREAALSNIATWWCGQDKQRDHVMQNKSTMMVGDAFSTRPLMADLNTIELSGRSGSIEEARITEMLQSEGHNLVGQEAVTLSTTPVFENGELVPRPVCIRISLSRTESGWSVMPGGYARVSAGDDAKALTMQQGGKVADVWVMGSPQEKVATRPLPAQDPVIHKSSDAMLPSRAADNLFWLGRYIERSEQNMRLFRAYFARISDGADHDEPLPVFLRSALLEGAEPNAQSVASLFSQPLVQSLQSASRISDRFSPDGMMALRSLVHHARDLEGRPVPLDDISAEISGLLRQITGFSGLVHENMYRSDGWRFLSLGVSLERAANLCHLLAVCFETTAPEGALDLVLEIGDSIVSHRARFQILANTESVADLMGLDTNNPRSIRYHVSRAKDHIGNLPQPDSDHILSDIAGRILQLETRLAVARPPDLSPDYLLSTRQDVWAISDALTTSHLA